MSVSYSKEQRAAAIRRGWPLVTVSVPGCEFQGPVPPEEAQALTRWLTEMFERRYAKPSLPEADTSVSR
jgi:hypothetical protein